MNMRSESWGWYVFLHCNASYLVLGNLKHAKIWGQLAYLRCKLFSAFYYHSYTFEK